MACNCKNRANQAQKATQTQKAAEARRTQIKEQRAKATARENAQK